ncbi:hypothetical protein JCM3775_004364 [Rhodotorula graminis]|uniref:tRNA (guanine(9)-N1)-methyltransferase n=1 Tax=Rhodotorula graminis (strain WP1) TaxID=578459 RepID=A0A194SEM7_RHOGW|nr:uncharacterized protein RHOBADRAFT_50474 [Rhodotorula graminis WP1]KPV77951.1 hypothetical protein RHOBADRAFT_50474 [Rhodotorula graminis WP1]
MDPPNAVELSSTSSTSVPQLESTAPAPAPADAQPVLQPSSSTIDAADPPAAALPAADASTTSSAPADPPLSKSALKRQRKQEAFQAQKLQRRAHEKEKRKAKAAEVKKLVAEGKMDKPVNKKRRLNGKQVPHGARIAIDMGFDHLMSDKEAKSMASQLGYCYSANRGATHPFPLLITSFTGRLREAYEKRGDHVSWKGVEWWEDGIDKLYEGVDDGKTQPAQADGSAPVESRVASTSSSTADPSSAAPEAAAPTSAPEPASVAASSSSSTAPVEPPVPLVPLGTLAGKPQSRAPRSTVVYLTGDSPNVLTTLSPGHTYILGGIVDHNRYKNLCLDKANALGIAHAQLPIGEFLPELQTRKVLTVNQVYEILVGWVEEGERADGWREALRRVMPERKLNADSRKERRSGNKAGGGVEGEVGEQDDEDEDDGVYVARDDDEDDVEMVVEQVDAAREAVERDEEQNEAAAVVANVDGDARA